MFRRFVLTVAALLSSAVATHGAPANPKPFLVVQPDGATFQARVRGDEFQGWVEAEDGHTVVRERTTGFWHYGTKNQSGRIVPTDVRVEPRQAPPQDIPLHLAPARDVIREARQRRLQKEAHDALLGAAATAAAEGRPAFGWTPVSVSGDKHVLLILVGFQDRALVTTASQWASVLFSGETGAKSVANYYAENSYGRLTLKAVPHNQPLSPPGVVQVALATKHPDYGDNITYALEKAWLEPALVQASAYVDFASYDANGDGTLRPDELAVYFILAGYDASGGAKPPNVWAHAWSSRADDPVHAGSVILSDWALNGELNNSDHRHPMGVVAHELGHSLCGLPDLYDTTYHNAGLGDFSLMAGGSWGANIGEDGGTTPVALDAWSRQYVRWASPLLPATVGARLSLEPALSSPSATVKLSNPDVSSTEYFLAENRYPSGWDLGLRDAFGKDWKGGLLILHVDEAVGSPADNDINAYKTGFHQGVMAEEASSFACSPSTSDDCRGAPTNLFYAGNNDEFTSETIPNSNYYFGEASGLGVAAISAPGETMTFAISPGVRTPGSLTVPETDPDGAYSVTWSQSATAGVEYELQEAADPSFTSGLRTVYAGPDTSAPVTARSLATTYHYRVRATLGAELPSKWCLAANGCTVTLPLGEALDNSNLTWSTLGSAGWYSQGEESWYGGSSARSGLLGHNQTSLLRATTPGPGTVTFRWKVSSDAGFDVLAFRIDGVEQAGRISGDLNWEAKTYAVTEAGPHLLEWTYAKDGLVTNGSDAAWVDQVVWAPAPPPVCKAPGVPTVPGASASGSYSVRWASSATGGATYELQEAADAAFTTNLRIVYQGPQTSAAIAGRLTGSTYFYRVRATAPDYGASPWAVAPAGCAIVTPVPLSTALDNSTVGWGEAGTSGWFGQSDVAFYGGAAARSGPVGDGQSTSLKATVEGAGTIGFRWKVSSETGFDILSFWIDGIEQRGGISGSVDWQAKTYEVFGTGTHVLEWRYAKDGLRSSGADCGWLDQVVWTSPAATPCEVPGAPTVPAASATAGYRVRWSASATVGAGYELQEATNAAFTDGLRTAYTGGDLGTTVTGRGSGETYYYRVRATASGHTPSLWMNGANGCAVTIVPGANRAPLLEPIGSKTLGPDEALQFTVQASDPDGDDLTLRAGGLPTGASFDPATGVLRWMPSATQTGNFMVTFSAVDSGTPPLSAWEVVPISVGDVNHPPILYSVGPRRLSVGEALDLQVYGDDPDYTECTFSASDLPPGAQFYPWGELQWTPDRPGVYRTTFLITDGGTPPLTAWETVTITVGDVNRPPVNRPPVLDPIGDQVAAVGQTLRLRVTGADPDEGNHLAFSAYDLPPGATFDPAAQEFAWTPAAGDEGTRVVRFKVTDNGTPPQGDSKALSITVGGGNRPPVLDFIGNRQVMEGETLSFTLGATDPDGGPLRFSDSGIPEGASFDPDTGVFSWTPAPGQSGVYALAFGVSDAGNLSDVENLWIEVGPVNRPPRMEPLGGVSTTVGAPVTLVVTANDPDGDPLTFSALPETMPAGATFAPETQEFHWVPSQGQVGLFEVCFQADDNGVLNAVANRIAWISVAEAPSSGDGGGGGGGGCFVTAAGGDLDGATLWSLLGLAAAVLLVARRSPARRGDHGT